MSNLVGRYIQIQSALSLTSAEISVSEVHGVVVGAIANHMKSGKTPNLLQLVDPEADINDGSFARLSENLYALYRENSEMLLENSDEFALLLPDDDEPLEMRVEALSAWSKGYLLGLLYNNAFSIDQLPESGEEFARDIMQIAEASAGHDAEQEEDWALAELEEYLKVGCQLVFASICSERTAKAPTLKQ